MELAQTTYDLDLDVIDRHLTWLTKPSNEFPRKVILEQRTEEETSRRLPCDACDIKFARNYTGYHAYCPRDVGILYPLLMDH